MRIILEFEENESELAERSYKGPQYFNAIQEFRAHLRNKVSHGDFPQDVSKELSVVYQDFLSIFEGMLLD